MMPRGVCRGEKESSLVLVVLSGDRLNGLGRLGERLPAQHPGVDQQD